MDYGHVLVEFSLYVFSNMVTVFCWISWAFHNTLTVYCWIWMFSLLSWAFHCFWWYLVLSPFFPSSLNCPALKSLEFSFHCCYFSFQLTLVIVCTNLSTFLWIHWIISLKLMKILKCISVVSACIDFILFSLDEYGFKFTLHLNLEGIVGGIFDSILCLVMCKEKCQWVQCL